MSACTACGFDASAVVSATWSFHIARDVKSLNAHTVNAGATRWRYAKERDAWQFAIRMFVRSLKMPYPDHKRRVTFTRRYSGRQRELDADNYRGGLKMVVDALVREQVIRDDNSTWLEAVYRQVKVKVNPVDRGLLITDRGLLITVEEFA